MTKISRFLVSALTGLLLLSVHSQAQSEGDKLALAKAFLEHNMVMMDLDKMAAMSMQPILASLKRYNPEITDEKFQEANETIQTITKTMLVNALYDLDKDLVEIFTLQELKAMDTFYRTPEGQSVLKKMPIYMQKVQPRITTAVVSTVPQVKKAIQELGLKTR